MTEGHDRTSFFMIDGLWTLRDWNRLIMWRVKNPIQMWRLLIELESKVSRIRVKIVGSWVRCSEVCVCVVCFAECRQTSCQWKCFIYPVLKPAQTNAHTLYACFPSPRSAARHDPVWQAVYYVTQCGMSSFQDRQPANFICCHLLSSEASLNLGRAKNTESIMDNANDFNIWISVKCCAPYRYMCAKVHFGITWYCTRLLRTCGL